MSPLMLSRTIASSLFVVASAFVARSARADGLKIETVEHGAWGRSVAAMQTDIHSEGSAVHVLVRDGSGRELLCSEYTLALDPDGAHAFHNEGCDPTTNQTTLGLVRRGALFDHDEGISRPRTIDIAATRVETAQAGGGARVEAQSNVSCTADVQPFLPDLENGSRAALSPDRYKLEVHDDDVHVTRDGSHWKLSRAMGGPRSAAYDVVDLKTGDVVLRDRVTLGCGASTSRDDSSGTDATTVTIVRTDDMTTTTDDSQHASKSWEGHAWSMNVAAGVALLRPKGLQLQNSNGIVDPVELGVHNTAATAIAMNFVYERPWLYASVGPNMAFASQNGRTLLSFGGGATVGLSLHFGPFSAYVGPNLAITSYQLTGENSAHLEWGTKADVGLGAASGLRVHIKADGASTAILGIDVIAPVAGNQPLFIMASLGWGAGH